MRELPYMKIANTLERN